LSVWNFENDVNAANSLSLLVVWLVVPIDYLVVPSIQHVALVVGIAAWLGSVASGLTLGHSMMHFLHEKACEAQLEPFAVDMVALQVARIADLVEHNAPVVWMDRVDLALVEEHIGCLEMEIEHTRCIRVAEIVVVLVGCTLWRILVMCRREERV
jgi:hypothetical protein